VVENIHVKITCRIWVAVPMLALCVTSCAPREEASREPSNELVRCKTDSVEVVLRAGSSVVRVEENLFLTLETTAPAEFDLSIPSAAEFLDGFEVQGKFDDLPVDNGGMTTRRRRLFLRPEPSLEYTIGPILVQRVDHGRNPPLPGAFEIPRISLPLVLPVAAPPDDIVVLFNPIASGPSLARMLARAAPAVVGFLGVVLLALYMRRKTSQAFEPLSPREAALRELRELMDLDLPAKGRIDDFYRALADVVRRYMEHTHAIMAPEQTTEELLAAVTSDPQFRREFRDSLAQFLREADGVKFAGHWPEAGAIREEVGLAQAIIEEKESDG
jgi:hypothetical protein